MAIFRGEGGAVASTSEAKASEILQASTTAAAEAAQSASNALSSEISAATSASQALLYAERAEDASVTPPDFYFDTLADLVTSTNFTEGEMVQTKCHSVPTDNGGATYRIVTTATYAAEEPDSPTPDGEVVNGRRIGMDHTIGSTGFIAKYHGSVGHDRACGVLGDQRLLETPLPEGQYHDDLPALNKLVNWGRLDSPQDTYINSEGNYVNQLQKGYRRVVFHPRSKFYTNGSLDLRNSRYDYDFAQCIIIPMTATVPALLWDGIFCSIMNLVIEGLQELTRHDWMLSQEPLIEWGADEPGYYSNGSHVTFEQVLARGGYHTFKLNSVDNSDASYIWGSHFLNCYFQDAVEFNFYFNSPFETSTTMTYDTCHARCVTRDSVTIGAYDYFCIRHHIANSTNEPEVGADWQLYWVKKDSVSDRGTWTSGNQYLTQAKGFYFNNVSSVSLLGCSQDGGVNTLQGSVIDYTGQFLFVDRFHLESYNHDEINTTKPIFIRGDFKFEELFLATHRFNLPDGEKAYFIGGPSDPVDNGKRATILNTTNKTPIFNGTDRNLPVWVDCAGFFSLELGVGVPLNAVENVSGSVIAQRGINNRTLKNVLGGAVLSLTPSASENGYHYFAGDGGTDHTLNITLDDYDYTESSDTTGTIYATFEYDFTLREGPNKNGRINFIGANGAAIVPQASFPAGTYRATKVSATRWHITELSSEGERTIASKVGSGVDLTYGKVNYLESSGGFNLPLASDFNEGNYIIVAKSETYKNETPTINCTGSDNIRYSGGTDTALQLDVTTASEVRFVSNGIDEWSI